MNTTMNTATLMGRKSLVLGRLAMVLMLPAVLIACSSDKKATPSTLNAPTLANAADQTYTVGTAIETLKFVNTGGDALTACTSAPALPMGLAVAVSTPTPGVGTTGTVRDISCQITGTPTEVAAEKEYVITGTNVTGMDAATVKITVGPGLSAEDVIPACTNLMATADGYPIMSSLKNTDETTSKLYVRGNISNWAAQPAMILEYKGIQGAGDAARGVYQAAVTTNTINAENYDAAGTQFKLASDGGSWDTQFYVPTNVAADLNDGGGDPEKNNNVRSTGLALDTNYNLLSGTSGSSNMSIALVQDSHYVFTFFSTIAADAELPKSDGSGDNNGPADDGVDADVQLPVGSMRIEPCRVAEAAIPGTSDFVVIANAAGADDPKGVIAPNQIVITTFDGDFNVSKNTGGAGSTGDEVSDKMTYTVDSATGVVTVVVSNEADVDQKFGFFTTLFSGPDASPSVTRDLTAFREGVIKFDIESADWGIYKVAGGFIAKVDHNLPNMGYCGCNQSIDASGWMNGQKQTVTLDVGLMVKDNNLDLGLLKSSLVVWPLETLQMNVTGAADDGDNRGLTFEISNVRWEAAGGTDPDPTPPSLQ